MDRGTWAAESEKERGHQGWWGMERDRQREREREREQWGERTPISV
jgi:hypothetical protein